MENNNRAVYFYKQIVAMESFSKKEWSIKSGAVNRELRNAILFAGKKEAIYLRYAFNYWQIKNQIRNTNSLDIKKIMELDRQCQDMRKEIFNEKEKKYR